MSVDGNLAQNLRVGGGYEYLDAEITSGVHDGSRVPLVPEHKATCMRSTGRLPNGWCAWTSSMSTSSTSVRTTTTSSKPLDAYTVANLVVHRDLGDWRLSARVNNLFDEHYSETGASSFAGDGFNPAPERNFWIGASYQLEN